MTDASELKELKMKMSPLVALFCCEQSVTCSEMTNPILMGTFKIGNLSGSLATECCCVTCSCTEACWSEERGCCEIANKCCCFYSELQCPPGKDIGIGCCGVAFCRTSDDAPEPVAQDP